MILPGALLVRRALHGAIKNMKPKRQWLWNKTNGRCAYCGCRFIQTQMTIDHVVPRSRGGNSLRPNLLPCCPTCNASKGTLSVEEFRRVRSRRAARHPHFNQKQIGWLLQQGFMLPEPPPVKFYWEELGNTFPADPVD